MALNTTRFDAAEHLADPADHAALIADAFDSGDATYIAHALGIVARARGMSQVARDAGVSREALYKALTAGGDPKLSTLLGVARALGIHLSAQPMPAVAHAGS
jgi:probable addiction module antidote protein